MAETTTLKKSVLSGYHEYLGTLVADTLGDKLEFEFDKDFSIDQIAVSTATNGWNVTLKYPSSGVTSAQIMNTTGDKALNPYPGREGRMWYDIPANTKVILTIDALTTGGEALEMTILGRG